MSADDEQSRKHQTPYARVLQGSPVAESLLEDGWVVVQVIRDSGAEWLHMEPPAEGSAP